MRVSKFVQNLMFHTSMAGIGRHIPTMRTSHSVCRYLFSTFSTAFDHSPPPKNKKCANRSRRTKNANSDCRQTDRKNILSIYHLAEFAFLSNSIMVYAKKGHIIPLYNINNYSICLAILLYHIFINKSIRFLINRKNIAKRRTIFDFK